MEALPALGTVGTVVASRLPEAKQLTIDETLFVGDSNTARYLMYADETGTAFTAAGQQHRRGRCGPKPSPR